MKKYKLIKEFPGSPKLGTINTNDQLSWKGEDYPEFWEKVVEKDYEILSIKSKTNSEIRKVKIDIDDNNKLFLQRNEENQYFLHSDTFLYIFQYYNIHSVKRLSDGEIFTIGDKIRFIDESLEETYPCRIIKNFKIKDNTIIAVCDSNIVEILLKNLKKVKQPLFTTEDGVDIFEGNVVYYVETEEEPELCFIVNEYTVLKYPGRFISDKSLHSFSTKEKAEEYIIMNKPCLSINDVKSCYGKKFSHIEECKKLVKIKLKND